MIVICIKQHLSNIWSSIHDKIKQHWSWAEKSVAYKKRRVLGRLVGPCSVKLTKPATDMIEKF